ncbi:MAG: hypothetical protein JWR16_2529 [Nevskia sp.]|nr:hypothetical protein [Nevskia sp.]
MKTYKLMMATAVAAMSLGLMACTSNGDGTGSDGGGGGITTGGTSSGTSGGTTGGSTGGGTTVPNDGSTPTDITDGGVAVTGNFICTVGSRAYGTPTTEIGTHGVVGGLLTTILRALGATTLTDLLNSISEPDNVIDGNLDTYATVSFTVGLLGGLLDSIDESVILPIGKTVPAGKYAVFGVSFPNGLANVALLNSIAVTTFNNAVQQETNKLNQAQIVLLKVIGGSTPTVAFIGVKTTKAYDTAQISLTPGLLTANVGDAMHIHELCTDGRLVTPVAP